MANSELTTVFQTSKTFTLMLRTSVKNNNG